MTFPERNACLADAWSSLTTEERDYFNSPAKTEKVIPTKEQIKRTLKRISNEVMKTNLFPPLRRYVEDQGLQSGYLVIMSRENSIKRIMIIYHEFKLFLYS